MVHAGAVETRDSGVRSRALGRSLRPSVLTVILGAPASPRAATTAATAETLAFLSARSVTGLPSIGSSLTILISFSGPVGSARLTRCPPR